MLWTTCYERVNSWSNRSEVAERGGVITLQKSETRGAGDGDQEFSDPRDSLFRFGIDLLVVEVGVSVRYPVSQSGRAAEGIRDFRGDSVLIGENIESGTGVLGWSQAIIGNPMGGQVDAFLYRQEQVERRQVEARSIPP
jgi:hypothetical protein